MLPGPIEKIIINVSICSKQRIKRILHETNLSLLSAAYFILNQLNEAIYLLKYLPHLIALTKTIL